MTTNRSNLLGAALGLAAFSTAIGQVPQLMHYQGRVTVSATNFEGQGQFKFALVNGAGTQTLWSNDGTSAGGGEPSAAVALSVTKGFYAVQLGDANLPNMSALPPAVFTNSDVRLRVWFNDGAHGFQRIAPDQRIAAVAYALMANTVADGSITAAQLAPGAVNLTHLADGSINAAKLANATVVRSINTLRDDVTLSAGANVTITPSGNTLEISATGGGGVWSLSGNSGTTAGAQFLGTTDDQPVELKVNGLRALRLEPTGDSASDAGATPDGAPNVIAGAPNNWVAPGTVGATISGGGSTNWGGSAWPNGTSADFGTISGGAGNAILANALFASIGGGRSNRIDNAFAATIAGGVVNSIEPDAWQSVIAGGAGHSIQSNAYGAVIGGGVDNTIQTNGQYGTIPGGSYNSATRHAFAAGYRARANHAGSFVWAAHDNGAPFDFASTADNQFNARASGGYRLFSNSGATTGVSLAPGSGSWTSLSDRDLKENFAPVDAQAVLAKVVALSLATWNYKSQDADIRHLGPTAQDFKAAFGLGETDRGITGVDADGVALAAIQGLHQLLKQKERQVEALQTGLATVQKRLAALESAAGDGASPGTLSDRKQPGDCEPGCGGCGEAIGR